MHYVPVQSQKNHEPDECQRGCRDAARRHELYPADESSYRETSVAEEAGSEAGSRGEIRMKLLYRLFGPPPSDHWAVQLTAAELRLAKMITEFREMAKAHPAGTVRYVDAAEFYLIWNAAEVYQRNVARPPDADYDLVRFGDVECRRKWKAEGGK